MLSKWSGALGNDWTNLRATWALIESIGVESTGPIPFLRISNDVTAAINRSGKRREQRVLTSNIGTSIFRTFSTSSATPGTSGAGHRI